MFICASFYIYIVTRQAETGGTHGVSVVLSDARYSVARRGLLSIFLYLLLLLHVP